jgi:SagB-type dehydrogenase family enzyme
MTSVRGAEPWYLAEGKEAQRLLEEGRSAEAAERFKGVLAGFGEEASYGRVVMLERLGRALLLAGHPDEAIGRLHQGLDVAGRLAPSANVTRLRGTLRSGLGDALRAIGRADEARRAYHAALAIGKELNDPRSQGVDEARLGALALALGDLPEAGERYRSSLSLLHHLGDLRLEAAACHQLAEVLRGVGDRDEADRHYQEAARLHADLGDLAAADQSWAELTAMHREGGRAGEAERWCRKSIEARQHLGPSLPLARRLVTLAEVLRDQPGRLPEAARVAEQALAMAQSAEPTAREGWEVYTLLADLHEALAGVGWPAARAAQIAAFRDLARRAPGILEAVRRVGDEPGLGRAVILGRLGRCFCVGGRPDLGVKHFKEALAVAAQLAPEREALEVRDMLEADLAGALGRPVSPEIASDATLPDADPAALEVFAIEDTETDYAFDPDLLLDGPRARTLRRCERFPVSVAGDVRPALIPGTRAWLDPRGWIHFRGSGDEPQVRLESGCTVARRTLRELAIGGATGAVWSLIHAMDGRSTVSEILSGVSPAEQDFVRTALEALIGEGFVDPSGRAVGGFVHWATRKGVLPAGGLEQEEVLRHATDPKHHPYDDRPLIPLKPEVPERLRAFHELTRRRRSRRDYQGGTLAREDFDALLGAACGVTGTLRWEGREVNLRAYPSSGALYAVGIYPFVLRVESLTPGVYHFDADANGIRPVRVPLDPNRVIGAALPMEREMLAGVAAMFCLTGLFPRHERKYGEGGYRMLVAEAGHVSQSLVLAATALGIRARPFGGVFDSLINRELGLDEAEEQFLLAVVAGP